MRRAVHNNFAGWVLALSALIGSGAAHASLTVGVGSTMPLGGGSAMLGCAPLVVGGVLQVQSGQVRQATSAVIQTTGHLDNGSGLVEVSGNWINSGGYVGGTGTVRLTNVCGNSALQIIGSTAFNRLELGGGAPPTLTITLPALSAGLTTVTQSLSLTPGATAVNVQGPACAGILLGPGVALPPAGAIVLGPDNWIAHSVPTACAGLVGTGGATAAAIPTLNSIALLALGLLMVVGLGWRSKPSASPRRGGTPNP